MKSALPSDVIEGMERLDKLIAEIYKQGIIITNNLDVIVTPRYKIYEIIRKAEYRDRYEEELYGV